MKIKPEIRLFSNKHDLNAISFFLLLISDIFVCVVLFYGLSQQISQFTDEHDYIPRPYRDMLIQNNWVENNIHEKISDHVLGNVRSTFEKLDLEKSIHPKCQEVMVLFNEIENDRVLIAAIESFERLLKNYKNLNREERNSQEGKLLLQQIQNTKIKLNENPKIELLITTIYENQNYNFTNDLIKFRKIFALKRTAFDFIFLLPVLGLFIFWNRKSYFKDRYIQVIISSHYIIVACLPILFESIRLVIEIIPKILLKTIYDFLLKLNLISFWYYIVLFISVVVLVFLIRFFQTKVFTKEKHRIRQFEKSKCMSCNTKINYKNNNCPVCGAILHVNCTGCGKNTYKSLPFCMNCGNTNDNFD